MQHLSLDAQPEVIRKFVMTMVVAPDGTLLELGGRPVACLLPPPRSANTVEGEEWTDARNRRRCQLIDQKYDNGLTPSEEAELATLQTEIDRHVDRVAPLPLDEARNLHQQLLDKARKANVRSDA